MNRKRITSILTLIASGLLGLAGCGGSGGGDSTGTLSIGLTDGPVDDASEVVIQFTGLELKPAGGPPEVFDIDPDACDFDDVTSSCSIDLLTLRGMTYKTLFAKDVPAGEYQWVRLLVNAERNTYDSYITLIDGPSCSLYIPSGSNTGLKIVSGMTVTANGVSNYMLDFDVRKSVTAPPGLPPATEECAQDYVLKPAIRIIDETESGAIAGTIDPNVFQVDGDPNTLVPGCRDEDPTDGVIENLGVYVFEDFDDTAVADDYDGDGDPITSALVEWNGTEYTYEVGYLLEGNYKLGLTCTADVDVMPGVEGKIADNYLCDAVQNPTTCEETTPPFDFVAEIDVTVAIDDIADGSFPPPATPAP